MKIPLFKIYWDKDDLKETAKSIKRGMNWAAGPNIEKFEELLQKYTGRKFALVFNSGTSALHCLLLAYGIGKGDEVIVPSFSFIATANAVLMAGATPIFADIEKETYGLNPEDVKKKITKNTKAILPMHYGGLVSKGIKELAKIAKENNLLLIEDSAESFGAKLDNQLAGTFGDSAMFSFCQTKVFTTGEGGCIITDSKEIYEKLKLLRAHGRLESTGYFSTGEYLDYISLGYNFRMADIVAALGISQIKKADRIIKIRRSLAKYMEKKLKGIKGIEIPQIPGNIFHVYQEFWIRAENRDSLKKFLLEKGIGTRISFKPIHLTHFYQSLGYKDSLKNTEEIAKKALTLPLYPVLTKREIDYISKQIKSYYENKN